KTTYRYLLIKTGTMTNCLPSFIEALSYYKTHRAESIQMIQEFLRVKDEAIAEEAYDYFSRITPAKPYPSVEGVRTVLADMAKSDFAAKSARPEDFVDLSFMKKLEEGGFIDRLYGKN